MHRLSKFGTYRARATTTRWAVLHPSGVTRLKKGDVLVTGGMTYCGIGCFKGTLSSAEIYHPH